MPKLRTLKSSLHIAGQRLATVQSGSWRTSSQSSSGRGYGYRWQKARASYLEKYPFCVYCLRDAGIEETEHDRIIGAVLDKGLALPYASVVDHKVPHRGDQDVFWDRSNWQSLCATHHSRDKQREESSRLRHEMR